MKKKINNITNAEWINIKGATTHNLKNIDVALPRGKMTVCTGLSGSGKSSLAFDTIFAEGQRKYIESLSAYARQFLRQMQKPEVREITGLSPAISIDQKNRSNNPRSNVATITEVYDYMRVLFSRVGKPYCPKCDKPIEKVSKEEIVKRVKKNIIANKWLERSKKINNVSFNDRTITVYSPVVIGRKGEYYQMLYDMLRKGFEKVKIDGKLYSLRNRIEIKKTMKHDIDVMVDKLFLTDLEKKPKAFIERLSDAIEISLNEANGLVKIIYPDQTDELISSKFLCAKCGFSFPEIEPRLFSFNSPYGACQGCNGLGQVDIFDNTVCKECNGNRLKSEATNVYIHSKNGDRFNIIDVVSMSVEKSAKFFESIKFTEQEKVIAETLIQEIRDRISFMLNVGLDYLELNRKANTLSGGEAQRIRLASQLGSGLVGALYVLDEPTIGLHQRDNDRLIKTLLHLRDLGNTIIVVEHDEDTIYASDYLIDIGPGAGVNGGNVVVSDFLDTLLLQKTNKSKSRTLAYLRGEDSIPVPKNRRKFDIGQILFKNIEKNNIKNESVEVPLGKIVCITGVSGSGKSTLMHNIIFENLKNKLEKRTMTRKLIGVKSITGYDKLNRVVLVDQSPIGRTPRSTPATYVGAFNHIRDLFASTEDARYRGWKPGRFSFNVSGGRCEKCEGNGVVSIEMHFLPTVYVTCDECNGKRYSKEVLDIKYNGKNIHEVLKMAISDAAEFFKSIPTIHDRLKTLVDVGLGYLELGQSSTTLSGGEAQRVKIASELYRPNTRKTIYLLDEPTVGLHYDDVKRLIAIINELVDRGNTAVIIEHNMDVIKNADYIIDMGPEGGTGGGSVIAKGTPENVSKVSGSHTGKYLKKVLSK